MSTRRGVTARPSIRQLMTQSAYARHRGVSRQAVHLAIRRGKISQLGNGLIDVRDADLRWAVAAPTGRRPRPLEKVS